MIQFGLIATIYVSDSSDCADITISDNATDKLIAVDAANLTDCADTIVLDDVVDGLLILMR